LQDGLNFRVKLGKLTNLNLGWEAFSAVTLNGPVKLIANFFIRGLDEKLIFGTLTDLYVYNSSDDTVDYITPRYDTGTANPDATTGVVGTGTLWLANAKAGDEIHFGAAGQNDPNATWYEIDTVTDDTHLVLVSGPGNLANGPYTIRQKFTMDPADEWSTETFVDALPDNEDEWWATNGVDFPVKWNGTDTQVTSMASLGFKAHAISKFFNVMIFGNLNQAGTLKPTEIINSDVGNPSDVLNGLAGQFRIHDGTDGILHMKQMGDNMVFYSEDTVTVGAFVGGDTVFIFRNAITGVGAVGKKAVANFGHHHEFVGKATQYKFDGVTVTEIAKHVWREILRQQDPLRISSTYAHFDEENGDVIWSVPSTVDPGAGVEGAGPTVAYGEHYLETVPNGAEIPFSKRSFPFTATGHFEKQEGITWADLTDEWANYNFRWNDRFFFSSFPFTIAGDENGMLWSVNTVQDAAGVAMPSYVTFGRKAVGDSKIRGLVARIYPFVTQFVTPLDVTLNLSDHAMGSPTIMHTMEFDQNLVEGGHFVSPYRRGRFMEIKFGTDGPSEPWEISGYDVDVRPGGAR